MVLGKEKLLVCNCHTPSTYLITYTLFLCNTGRKILDYHVNVITMNHVLLYYLLNEALFALTKNYICLQS